MRVSRRLPYIFPRFTANMHFQHQAPHMPHQRQQHHQQATPQHTTAYQPAHLPQYGQNGASQGGQHAENPYYTHTSPYTAPSATGPYTSAGTIEIISNMHRSNTDSHAASEAPDILAASGMTRAAYPSIYHTPQSNSPASIASPSGHDQHGRQIYTQTPYHLQQQQAMNYPPPPSNYPQIPQGNPSPYGQQQQPQHHQGMGQQSNLLMSHQQAQHQMQHPSQLSQQMPSPRGAKPDLPPNGLQRSAPVQQGQTPQQHHQQILNAPPNGTQNNIPGAGVNPTTNPGPIPATTPLIVRQDQNGVQWIAFEYSRDRVKMEYTIRCDVEAVNVDNLSADFKSENCVYPRACCSKDQYRGNRFGYETDCNTVGWGLAELNPCLRGKRGLIQRAVDSWRNSNQDPKYRSRRVRRMAKLTNRKNNGMAQMAAQMQMPGQGMALPDMTARAPPPAHRPGATMAQQQPLPQHHQQHAHPDHTAVAGPDDVTGMYPM